MWYEELDGTVFLMNLYNEIPELKKIRISEFSISDEGDRVTIGFDMPHFPDHPPKKWVSNGCNTAYAELNFFDIFELSVKFSKSIFMGDIKIIKIKNDTILIEITGNVNASIKAGFGQIASIRGYCNRPLMDEQ